MTHSISTTSPEYSRAEMKAICDRKNAITERIRSVDSATARTAGATVDPNVFWAALALAASRKDLYDGLAHCRAIHDPTFVRVDALAMILDADAALVAELAQRADAAIDARCDDQIFWVWAYACSHDETWQILHEARAQLRRT